MALYSTLVRSSLFCLIFVTACSQTSSIISSAETSGFKPVIFDAKNFVLFGCLKGFDKTLRVYIEGDGKAWLSRSRPSSDPTPRLAPALRMALKDKAGAVFYMARPCQYTQGEDRRNCHPVFWTSARFSEYVVQDMASALEHAKLLAGAERLQLVGYSGGGTIALLLASQREDIDWVVTIAGNLDHRFWTELHKVSPLTNSLNPIDFVDKLQHVRQVHLVSRADAIVPPEVIQSYVGRLEDASKVEIITVDAIKHTGDWTSELSRVLKFLSQ